MVVFSFEYSMQIGPGFAVCGGSEDDRILSFLIVLSYRMLEDKHCLSVGIFDRLHFKDILYCILCLFCIINYCY